MPRAGRALAISVWRAKELLNLLLSPPGRPHPVPGPFFYSGRFHSTWRRVSDRAPCATTLSQDGSFAPCACWPETSAGPRPRSRRSRSPPGAAGSSAKSDTRAPGTRRSRPSWRSSCPPRRSLPAAAGFGVAGPVRNGKSRITNLPWRLDAAKLSRRIGIRRLALVNDFGANARGLRYLGPRQVATLWRGRPEKGGPVAILGAGTGLGQAGVLPDGDYDVVVASEAGHVDFGPRTAQEGRLVDFLRARFGRATRERVLSGSGLELIYAFLASDGAARPNRAVTAELAAAEDGAAVISRHGLARRDPLCRAALDLWVSIYGSEAGNARPAVPRDRGHLRRRGNRREDPARIEAPRLPARAPRQGADAGAGHRNPGARRARFEPGSLRRSGRRAGYMTDDGDDLVFLDDEDAPDPSVGPAQPLGPLSPGLRFSSSIVSGLPSRSRTSIVVMPSCSGADRRVRLLGDRRRSRRRSRGCAPSS